MVQIINRKILFEKITFKRAKKSKRAKRLKYCKICSTLKYVYKLRLPLNVESFKNFEDEIKCFSCLYLSLAALLRFVVTK